MLKTALHIASTLTLAFMISACTNTESTPVYTDNPTTLSSHKKAMTPLPEGYNTMLNAGALVKNVVSETSWSDAGLWYRTKGAVHLIDPATGEHKARIDENKIGAALSQQFGPMGRQKPQLGAYSLAGNDAAKLEWNGVKISINLTTGEVDIPQGAVPLSAGTFKRNIFMMERPVPNSVLSPTGKSMATLKTGNIAIRKIDAPEFDLLTKDAENGYGWDITAGRRAFVSYRAGVTNPWSPDDRYIFAMKIDRRHMPQSIVYGVMDKPQTTKTIDSFLPGGPYYIYEPAIIDTKTGDQRKITGVDVSKDYVMFLDWSDNSETAWFGTLDRDFSTAKIISVDAKTGKSKVVFSETDERGIRSPHRVYYAGNFGFHKLPGDAGFLWESDKDGNAQFYHHAENGEFVRQATFGDYPVDWVEHVDIEKDEFYFTARSDKARPYDVHLLRAPLSGGTAVALTRAEGIHKVKFSSDGEYFSDLYSSPTQPVKLSIHKIDGPSIDVASADISKLRAAGWETPIEFSVKAADNMTDVYGIMYLPAGFDPKKKYPVIEAVYGGPTVVFANHEFPVSEHSSLNYPLALAQAGYIVFSMDTPGTPARDRKFRRAVLENWGAGVMDDHAEAIKNLGKKYAFFDTDRVGIFGHSWGGANTLIALGHRGDVYDAGAATAPGVNIEGVMLDGFMESYLGAPSANPDAWERAMIMQHVDKIENPLLLGVGTQDFPIYPATLHLSKALIERGFQHELMLAPGMGHGIYGKQGEYLQEKVTRFFMEHVPTNTD